MVDADTELNRLFSGKTRAAPTSPSATRQRSEARDNACELNQDPSPVVLTMRRDADDLCSATHAGNRIHLACLPRPRRSA